MKKLLILANSDSAIFKFRSELISELSKQFHIGIGIPFGQYMDMIANAEYEFFNIPINRHGLNPTEDFRLLMRYRRLIGQFKPDAILLYTIKPNLYGSMAARSKGIPCLCNITGLGGALEKKSMLQKLLIGMYRYAMKSVNTIFFQNQHGKEFFIEHKIGKESQYYLLPGSGVNLGRFKLLPYPEDELVRFFFIARVIKEKGIDEFLYTARRFYDEKKRAEFHVCGACEEAYDDILRQADEEGIIRYHGLVKDMRRMYEQASCVILPSYYPEGQSNVLLEGAASGRPLITTDHPGCREAVENGVSGFLVKSKNAEDVYAKACNIYYMQPEGRKQMGLAGRKKIEKEFDRNIVIEAYKERLSPLF
jgi:galacturonosyltransferase